MKKAKGDEMKTLKGSKVTNGKTMSRKQAIQAMLKGKEVTSDELIHPDDCYCKYDARLEEPFIFIDEIGDIQPLKLAWGAKNWRIRKYIPKDKELVYCWDEHYKAFIGIGYFDAKNNCTFSTSKRRNGYAYNNYAPYKGELPPNMCTVEELEE